MPLRKKNIFFNGFTLVELLVGVAIFSLLLVLLLGVLNQTTSAVKNTSATVDAFQQSRTAFDIMTRNLSQAVLNTYWDYYNSAGERRTPANAKAFQPSKYDRASDLHFLIQQNGNLGQRIFFVAPLAFSQSAQQAQTEGLLNACGYFVEFGDSRDFQPSLFSTDSRYRYRLMQSVATTENFNVFEDTSSGWTADVESEMWPIATNVIALIIQPRLALVEDDTGSLLSDDYGYDSRLGPAIQRAQLPPALQLTMVVIDKVSADRLDSGAAEPPEIVAALAGKFRNPTDYQADMEDLVERLNSAKITHQVFTTTVSLRESKWSGQ